MPILPEGAFRPARAHDPTDGGTADSALCLGSIRPFQENHMINMDFSCSCTQSILISDGHNNSITSILNSVFDSPIVITSARVVQLVADEVGSTSFTVTAGTLLMSTTYAFTSTTISGAGGKGGTKWTVLHCAQVAEAPAQ
jgi:hypothetical protein